MSSKTGDLANAHSGEVPRDDLLPGLKTVLDAEQIRGLIEPHIDTSVWELESCRTLYIRYKPGTNCLVSYALQCRDRMSGDSRKLLLYGKCYTVDDYANAAEKLESHDWVEVRGVNSVIPLAQWCSILYAFPNDRLLPGLRVLADRKKIQRLLYDHAAPSPNGEWRISDRRLSTDTVRYKPERRAVIRVSTRIVNRMSKERGRLCVYMRTYGDNRGETVFNVMNRLHEAFRGESHPTVPKPLAYLPERRLLITDELAGEPLLNVLGGASGGQYVHRVAKALANLHRFDHDEIVERSRADLVSDVKATANTLLQIIPEYQQQVEEVVAPLEGAAFRDDLVDSGFVHGDFYYGQVLMRDSGESILDFDRSYRGDGLADVGNFCAHLRWLKLSGRLPKIKGLLEAFITAYAGSVGGRVDSERLAFWTAVGLFQLSVRPFRTLSVNWKEQTSGILGACRELL